MNIDLKNDLKTICEDVYGAKVTAHWIFLWPGDCKIEGLTNTNAMKIYEFFTTHNCLISLIHRICKGNRGHEFMKYLHGQKNLLLGLCETTAFIAIIAKFLREYKTENPGGN